MTHRSALSPSPMSAQSGFTLIELVVTVAIVSVLALVAVPMTAVTMQRVHEGELRTALREIRTALDDYKKAVDAGRIEKRADGSGYPPNLDVLANGVEDAKSAVHQKIYFLRRLPRDPFAADPSQSAADTWGKRAYGTPPDAPAEGEDVYDVFSRSTQRGLNGIAYREW